jgi:hypothetical protein
LEQKNNRGLFTSIIGYNRQSGLNGCNKRDKRQNYHISQVFALTRSRKEDIVVVKGGLSMEEVAVVLEFIVFSVNNIVRKRNQHFPPIVNP